MNASTSRQNDYDSKLGDCRPKTSQDVTPETFEIGLTMAGAISAGAYTAGVIDFLIEALDAWYSAKASGQNVPSHHVNIRVMSGASAGAITGAIAAVALRYQYNHVHAGTQLSPNANSGNPLYNAWVEQIDISKLLELSDLKNGGTVESLLDSSCLTDIAKNAFNFTGTPTSRSYIADQLKLIFAVTNLRGVPYSINMRGNAATDHEMTAHADWQRFSVSGLNGSSAPSNHPICPDETALTFPNTWDMQTWRNFGTAALASGAFPIGLSPKLLERNASDYDYRYSIIPDGATQPAKLEPLQPAWNPTPSPTYQALYVDGGVMNNEPLDMARRELAGPLGRNPRDGKEANRAVVMIDPFPDPAEPGPDSQVGIFKTAMSLMTAWKEQARFKPEDVALAMDSTVYSRFLISPSRGVDSNVSNGFDLASGALGGFSGFLHHDYRRHDYLLGRRNCQKFLKEHLTLPKENSLFSKWSQAQIDQYLVISGGSEELPIIPLVGLCNPQNREEQVPAWPKGVLDLDGLKKRVRQRVDGVLDALKAENLNWIKRILANFVLSVLGVRGKITDFVISKIASEVQKRNL